MQDWGGCRDERHMCRAQQEGPVGKGGGLVLQNPLWAGSPLPPTLARPVLPRVPWGPSSPQSFGLV